MSSSGADMSAFMLSHLQGVRTQESGLLSDATIRQMHRSLFTHHPRLHGMAHGFMEGTFHDQRTLFHSGSTMLFDTGLYLLPDENRGLFISYSGGSYLAHLEIFQAFMDRYYPAEKLLPPLPPEGALERSRSYIGEYHQNRKSFTTPESVLSLTMGMIHVQSDEEGYLLVHHVGEASRFVESEQGSIKMCRRERQETTLADSRRSFLRLIHLGTSCWFRAVSDLWFAFVLGSSCRDSFYQK
ncbi:serine hydrolase [Brevibacillus invocatus]